MHTIIHFLKEKVLPWTSDSASRRLMVAQEKIELASLPSSVSFSPRQTVGRRVIVKGRRKYANQRLHIADWPEDNLQEITSHKLACVVEGTADYLLQNYCLHCLESTFVLIPPGTPHHDDGPFLSDLRTENAQCTVLFAHAHSQGVLLWFSRSSGKRHKNNQADNFLIPNAEAAWLFKLAIDEAARGQKNWEVICSNLLHSFFLILTREIEADNYMHPGPAKERIAPIHEPQSFADELTAYIEVNFNRPIKLADAAAQMYFSVPQFCRRVRQTTGTTFNELLTRYRMERAKELLRETNWTASAIASHVGFRSASYFQNVFRHHVGETPTEYRRKNDNIL